MIEPRHNSVCREGAIDRGTKVETGGRGKAPRQSSSCPHGSLSTHCRILLLLAPSRALAAPSRGGSTSFEGVRFLFYSACESSGWWGGSRSPRARGRGGLRACRKAPCSRRHGRGRLRECRPRRLATRLGREGLRDCRALRRVVNHPRSSEEAIGTPYLSVWKAFKNESLQKCTSI